MSECRFLNQTAHSALSFRLTLILTLTLCTMLLAGPAACVVPTPPPTPTPGVPAIALDPVAGPVGGLVTVRGVGWSPAGPVSIYILAPDQAELPSSALTSIAANAYGSFETRLIIPAPPGGQFPALVLLIARQADSGASAQALLNVTGPPEEPSVTRTLQPGPSPTHTPAGPASVDTLQPGPSPTRTPTPPWPGAPVGAATTYLNVRAGPGTNYPVLGWLEPGQSVEITGLSPDGGWWQIRFPGATGDRAWVSARHITAWNTENVPLVQPPPLPPTPQVIAGWRGEYFDNPNLAGQPVRVRDDALINFDWQAGAPVAGLPVDDFSVRWTRDLDFSAATYRFYVHVDDGVRLWLDGQLLIDAWHEAMLATYTAELVLAKGRHHLVMEYYEHTGNAVAQLAWERLGDYPDWKGEYYANPSLSGLPVLVRNDVTLDFYWPESPGPGLPPDNFSVRWTRTQHLPDDAYRFSVMVDDGARLWVDDELIIDAWRAGPPDDFTAEIWLSEGTHSFRLEYFEFRYGAQLYLNWGPLRDDDAW